MNKLFLVSAVVFGDVFNSYCYANPDSPTLALDLLEILKERFNDKVHLINFWQIDDAKH